jgi:apolipoprotein N-acyltransferase
LIITAIGFTLFYGVQKIKLPERDASLRVAMIQANVVTKNRMTLPEQKEHLNAYRQLSLKAAEKSPEIIIWPASSLPARITSTITRRAVQQIARDTGTYLLVGGAGVEKFNSQKEDRVSFSNSEFLYAPTGRVKKKYNKIRLVPFDEYLPLQDKVPWPGWITSLNFSFMRGKEYTLFEVNGAKFGTPICWENLFSDLVRRFVKAGAHFVVNVTNEGYTGRTSAPYQTLAMAVFRAVENRVPVLRAATTGVSAYISPNGEIVERIQGDNGDDLFVSGILVRDVPLHNAKTFYTMYGDIFAFVCIGLVVVSLIVALLTRKRHHPESGEAT